MTDPRIEKLAYNLINYSCSLKKGEKILIEAKGIDYMLVSRHAQGDVLGYDMLSAEVMAAHTLIINCTPLGMLPDVDTLPDIPYTLLTDRHMLYDCVYNPTTTAFLRVGQQQGARTINGLDMLYAQADIAWEIWNNK